MLKRPLRSFGYIAIFVLAGSILASISLTATGSQSVATAADDTCQAFPETGFSVCGKFLTYWQSHGGLTAMGYPVSAVFAEQNQPPPAGDGQVHQVQYFQRARLEEHLENQPPYDVLPGLLGSEQYQAKYAANPPGSTPTPTPITTPVSSTQVPAGCFQDVTTSDPVVQACVDMPSPSQNSDVAVYGRILVNGKAVSGASMKTTWLFQSSGGTCNATAASDGVAVCKLNIGTATINYSVNIFVDFSYNGKVYRSTTSFTPTVK